MEIFIEVLVAVLIFTSGLALSWGVTVGIIKLITLCFGWSFSLPVATGIWLVLFLLHCYFGKTKEG